MEDDYKNGVGSDSRHDQNQQSIELSTIEQKDLHRTSSINITSLQADEENKDNMIRDDISSSPDYTWTHDALKQLTLKPLVEVLLDTSRSSWWQIPVLFNLVLIEDGNCV